MWSPFGTARGMGPFRRHGSALDQHCLPLDDARLSQVSVFRAGSQPSWPRPVHAASGRCYSAAYATLDDLGSARFPVGSAGSLCCLAPLPEAGFSHAVHRCFLCRHRAYRASPRPQPLRRQPNGSAAGGGRKAAVPAPPFHPTQASPPGTSRQSFLPATRSKRPTHR